MPRGNKSGALLNYTTGVDAAKTVGEIATLLQKSGAIAILTEFDDDGEIRWISFRVKTAMGVVSYLLPCKTEPVLRILKQEYHQGKIGPRYVNEQQAKRVGWRIVKSWLEAQLAMVKTEMVGLDQIMLPFAQTKDGSTVYEKMIKSGFDALMLTEGD